MIRTLATSLFFATSAMAQTPVEVSAANDLRVCLLSANGFRDAARLAQLDLSVEQVRDSNWGQLTRVAPGVFQLLRSGTDRTIEIKLPDANGAAHCLAFGPSLTTGQGALTADKFSELSFMQGSLHAAAAPQGLTRRYTVTGAPYQADLIAYTTPSGDVVGFTFSGVPQNLETRALSSGDASVSFQGVGLAVSNALNICLRNYFQRETVEAALPAGGYEMGYADGSNRNLRTFFTPDNAVSLQIAPGQCRIETNYMGPAATLQIVRAALETHAPGGFDFSVRNHSGCPVFHAGPRLNMPLGINIYNNAGQHGPATCVEDGTSRIHFEVAG